MVNDNSAYYADVSPAGYAFSLARPKDEQFASSLAIQNASLPSASPAFEVTAITQVFGEGQKLNGVAPEYPVAIDGSTLSPAVRRPPLDHLGRTEPSSSLSYHSKTRRHYSLALLWAAAAPMVWA